MGALLSLPLMALPSVGTLATFAASCCGATACSALCSACGVFRSSIATRIAYACLLLVNSLVAWIMLTPWALKKLEHLTLDYMTITCGGDQACYGYVAVQRINFALGLFHLILSVLLIGVRSSKDTRAGLQNGFWGPKIIIWLVLIVITFLIPESFFTYWGHYFGFVGAMLFVLLGLVLLVDLAHTYAEWCLEKIENNDSNGWRVLLIGSTLGMYAASLAMIIVMYIFFAHSGCSMNQVAITINLLVIILISAISIHPAVQESNPRAGLAQSAMVSVYCTYLTMSAVSMEPNDDENLNCNPLLAAQGTRKASIVIGAILTMLTVAYTTTRAATQGFALGTSNPQTGGYHRVGDEPEHGLIDQQPTSSRREMRAEALRRAVAEGSLPANAIDDWDDDESEDGRGSKRGGSDKDDERAGTQYNYSLFHFIFLLATCWVASLLTSTLDTDVELGDELVGVGRTYWASWVKIVSAWTCFAIYTWSLVAPVVLPDRFGA